MRVVILGAGISGHTAALVLRRHLPRKHTVTVVSPNSQWNWIPSNSWVGTGVMKKEEVTFSLAPVYKKQKIEFVQAKATEIHPEGSDSSGPFVVAESTAQDSSGTRLEIPYDYLINATGPKLNFGATPGLGPEGNSFSVCSFDHAADTAKAFLALVAEMKKGYKKTLVVGTGHGTCTCEGAAFEYTFNIEFELRRHGVREMARIIYISNEAELGDFGVGGMQLNTGGYSTPGKIFAE